MLTKTLVLLLPIGVALAIELVLSLGGAVSDEAATSAVANAARQVPALTVLAAFVIFGLRYAERAQNAYREDYRTLTKAHREDMLKLERAHREEFREMVGRVDQALAGNTEATKELAHTLRALNPDA